MIRIIGELAASRLWAIRLLRNLRGSLKNLHSIDAQVLSRTDFSAQPTNLAQDTRIADSIESSLLDSAPLSAESWQSIKIKKDKNAKRFKQN